MTWLPFLLSSGDHGGRVNVASISQFYTVVAGTSVLVWDVYAKAAGESFRVLAGYATQAEAVAAIDELLENLLLNGS